MIVNLPDEVARRLAAEAHRRGQDVDQVAAELLAAGLPEAAEDALHAFIGCGGSGQTEPFDIHQARTDLAAQRLTESA